jgi:hypothetical protein
MPSRWRVASSGCRGMPTVLALSLTATDGTEQYWTNPASQSARVDGSGLARDGRGVDGLTNLPTTMPQGRQSGEPVPKVGERLAGRADGDGPPVSATVIDVKHLGPATAYHVGQRRDVAQQVVMDGSGHGLTHRRSRVCGSNRQPGGDIAHCGAGVGLELAEPVVDRIEVFPMEEGSRVPS